MSLDSDLVEAFLAEGRELVGRAAGDVALLSRDPCDASALDGLFRTVHTLKGSSGLLDLAELAGLQHAVESRMEAARRRGRVEPAVLDAVVAMLDVTEAWMDGLAAGAAVPDDRLARRTVTLMAELGRAPDDATARAEPAPAAAAGVPTWALALAEEAGETGAAIAVRYRPAGDAFFRGEDPLAIMRAIPRCRAFAAGLATEPAAGAPYDPFRCNLDLRVLSSASEAEVRDALRLAGDSVDVVRLEPRVAPKAPTQAQTIRVSGDRMDQVAALVDELVIAKNGLDHLLAEIAGVVGAGPRLRDLAVRRTALERAVSALHGAVTDLRLVSLRGLFGRFPRHVREAAAGLGKPIDFTTAGEEVVLDKSVAEQLFEPLLHLLRNAIDHGVESPAARHAAGKPDAAHVRLSARTAGDAVVIEVADDGRGIDADAVRDAAVARGLVDRAAADALDDAEAARLVFAAGFSTAREVGALSGRGVGMDAVRETAHRLGGRVDLENRPGLGLSVSLVLPARTVLTRVLVVEAAGERFAVPLQSVAETHRVRTDEVTPIRQGRAYVRRDAVIPILRLRTLLGLGEPEDAETFPVLCLAVGGEPLGVQVDALGAQVEAPLRPLDGLLEGYPGIMGSILEGDGRVLLVLDLAELAA